MGQLVEGETADLGDHAGEVGDKGGFAALAAVGDGGEERAIGFEEEAVFGDGGEGGADVGGIFEGGDPGETDGATQGDHRGGFIGGAGEAMEHGAELAAPGLEEGEGFVEGVALVDDHIELQFRGQSELLFEGGSLASLHLGAFGGGEVVESMEVEAGFAEGDHAGVAGEFAEGGGDVEGFLGDVVGVDADDGVDGGELIGESEGASAAGQGGAHHEDAFDAGLGGAIDDCGEIGFEIGEIEVGVGIEEDGHGEWGMENGEWGLPGTLG